MGCHSVRYGALSLVHHLPLLAFIHKTCVSHHHAPPGFTGETDYWTLITRKALLTKTYPYCFGWWRLHGDISHCSEAGPETYDI